MNPILEKYQQLNEREQLLIKAASVVTVLFLFYLLIWSPLNQSIEQNKQAIIAKQELLELVQRSSNQVRQSKASGSRQSFNGSLPQAVNQTAGRFSISISRMQPQDRQIQVWVDEAAFNQVVNWLQAIEQMGIVIQDADFSETSEPGNIRIRRLLLSQ